METRCMIQKDWEKGKVKRANASLFLLSTKKNKQTNKQKKQDSKENTFILTPEIDFIVNQSLVNWEHEYLGGTKFSLPVVLQMHRNQ